MTKIKITKTTLRVCRITVSIILVSILMYLWFNSIDDIKSNFDPREKTTTQTISNVIPKYNGDPYIVVNNNEPFFSENEYTTSSFEYYSDLDNLGRCGVCYACLGDELMPNEKRGDISSVKPSGWVNNKYDFIDGGYVYNRCHLIGYQLTGENANVKNLITGTRYMNVDGMLDFENKLADYIDDTDNHILYRVTPIFDGDNLVADGVQLEAISVEDNGKGIKFNVFCYNVQPGVVIDYATGNNWIK